MKLEVIKSGPVSPLFANTHMTSFDFWVETYLMFRMNQKQIPICHNVIDRGRYDLKKL